MSYTVITATLKSRTAIHIGSGQANGFTDALIRRDGAGNPLIPGTALAGALRSMLTRLGPRLGAGVCQALRHPDDLTRQEKAEPCGCGVCRLFGDINPTDPDNKQAPTAEASRLLVFNATFKQANSQTTIRDGVGINRVTGTAARAGAVKFDLEILPAETEFALRLELRNHDPEQDEKLLAAALGEWQAGRAWLGGRVARGLGAFTLEPVEFKQLDLNKTAGLMDFLKSDNPVGKATKQDNWLTDTTENIIISAPQDKESEHLTKTWFSITATLQADGPLLTNDTTTAGLTGFDHAPLLAQNGDWQNPVLNGSGLRGVIRSHAERLARTLATQAVKDEAEFVQKCPACSPVQSNAKEALASCDSLLKAMKFPIDDEVEAEQLCLACRLFGNTWQGSRLFVEDAAYVGERPPRLKMLDFVAIDRFTGGAADTAKFDALALWKPSFQLRLHLENPQDWELGWLALVLRDLQSGWLSVGMGAAKGFGRVKLEDCQMTLGYLHLDDLSLFELSANGDDKSGIYHTQTLQLAQAQTWVEKFRDEVLGFSRELELHLAQDSYFKDKISKLYPVKETL